MFNLLRNALQSPSYRKLKDEENINVWKRWRFGMPKEVLGVLASGRGSNFQAIIDQIELGVLRDVEPGVLISNNPDAPVLEIAEGHGVEREVIVPKAKGEEGRLEFEREAHKIFESHGVTLVVLAGFMRVLSPYLIRRYKWRMMNIHPALLPAFPGLHAHRQVLEYGAKVSGCTVHYVDEGVDTGPIILQHAVPVREDDTEETLAKRVLVFEHRLYSKAIQLHADGRLRVEGRRVRVDYSGGWEEEWNRRQLAYIRRQRELWERRGIPWVE